MDLNFTPEEEQFRSEVRAFLAEKLGDEDHHLQRYIEQGVLS